MALSDIVTNEQDALNVAEQTRGNVGNLSDIDSDYSNIYELAAANVEVSLEHVHLFVG